MQQETAPVATAAFCCPLCAGTSTPPHRSGTSRIARQANSARCRRTGAATMHRAPLVGGLHSPSPLASALLLPIGWHAIGCRAAWTALSTACFCIPARADSATVVCKVPRSALTLPCADGSLPLLLQLPPMLPCKSSEKPAPPSPWLRLRLRRSRSSRPPRNVRGQ